jgi:hypothetical protein
MFNVSTLFDILFLIMSSSHYFKNVVVNIDQLLILVVNVTKNMRGLNCLIIAKTFILENLNNIEMFLFSL